MNGAASTIQWTLTLATVAPLFSALVVIFFGKKYLKEKAGWFATGVMAGCFLLSLIAMGAWFSVPEGDRKPVVAPINWIPLQDKAQLASQGGSGVVYRDVNENGAFDAKIDMPLAGRTVQIFEIKKDKDGQTATLAAEMQTASDGTFAFDAKAAAVGKPQLKRGHWLTLGLLADSLTIAMVVMVTFIATLVHLYSIGYMHGDKRFGRFFAYLSLFTFSMLGIVTAHGLTQLFVFWELVGLTSYLLIGFWFEKRGPQLACKKAFVMNRVGDAGFLIGFGILFYKLGGYVTLPAAQAAGATNMLDAINAVLAHESIIDGVTYSITNPPMWLTAAGIGLFFGAIGKSAQFPLQTWLPDAMEGPTPVSSIVHSATMVAAGVYLTGRIYPILTPAAHLFIATIGLITLVIAALMALVMTDIKKVLAYSTLSQLGYMVLGLGSGAYVFALYHLITHAFFKCCLFQCSGSVIHAAHHEQDMSKYGGLGKKMPITMWCYGICTLAIAGASIPFTLVGISGFYSKDGIIAGTYNFGSALSDGGWLGRVFYWGPTIVAYLTVFYMARSFALTFLGKPRDQKLHDHAHEAPWQMYVPQICLAAMAILAAPMFFPWWDELIYATQSWVGVDWVQNIPNDLGHDSDAMHFAHAALLHGIGWILALGAGIFMYKDGFAVSSKIVKLPVVKQLYLWVKNKFYFDALYDAFAVGFGKAVAYFSAWFDRTFVDGLVNLSAFLTRMGSVLTGWFDNRAVDGTVNGAAAMAQTSGRILRVTHDGRVRGYVLAMFGTAVMVTLIVITVAIVTK